MGTQEVPAGKGGIPKETQAIAAGWRWRRGRGGGGNRWTNTRKNQKPTLFQANGQRVWWILKEAEGWGGQTGRGRGR